VVGAVARRAASSASAERVWAAARPCEVAAAVAPCAAVVVPTYAAEAVRPCVAAGPVAQTGEVAEASAERPAERVAVAPFGGAAPLVGMKAAHGTMGVARIQSRAAAALRASAQSKAGCSR